MRKSEPRSSAVIRMDGARPGAAPMGLPRGSAAQGPLLVAEVDAAALVDLSARTLQRLRLEGGGPAYVKLTEKRIAYAVTELERWIEARTVASTSDASAS